MITKLNQYKATILGFVLCCFLTIISLNNVYSFLITIIAIAVAMQLIFIFFYETTGIEIHQVINGLNKIALITKEYGQSEKANRLIEEELKKIFK